VSPVGDPEPVDGELEAQPTDRWYERCLKLMARVDWRGLAIVIAAVAGIVGAVWNKLDAAVDKALAARTQQGVYEVLAAKLDDVALRLTTLEAKHLAEGKTGAPVKPPATPRDKPVPGSESGRAPEPPPSDAMTMAVPMFSAAQLPSFATIQKRAQDDELPRLMQRDPLPASPVTARPGTN
jgi:hypothetical protein